MAAQVNNVPPEADQTSRKSFFDVTVSFPSRTVRFGWGGQRTVNGRTRLEARVWHHIAVSFSRHGGCHWCGRMSLFVNGALDHVWGYVEWPQTVQAQLYSLSSFHADS